MEQDQYKKAIIQKSKALYENLLKLSINPEDKQVTDNLNKLTIEVSEIH